MPCQQWEYLESCISPAFSLVTLFPVITSVISLFTNMNLFVVPSMTNSVGTFGRRNTVSP